MILNSGSEPANKKDSLHSIHSRYSTGPKEVISMPKQEQDKNLPHKLPVLKFEAKAFDRMADYLSGDLTVERGGFLLGSAEPDEIRITAFIEAKHTAATGSSLHFTALTWNDYDDRKKKHYPQLTLLGWAHSHPGLGVFLSNHDQTVNLFFQYLAVVMDPVSREAGFFYLKTSPQRRLPVTVIGESRVDIQPGKNAATTP